MAEQIRHRRARYPNPDPDPNSLRYRPTISSLFTSNEAVGDPSVAKKKNFSSSTFRGLGCAASSHVSVPAAIRTSANWESKKVKKKMLNTKKNSGSKLFCSDASAVSNGVSSSANPLSQSSLSLALSSSCVTVPDVWCGPGIGLTTDAASVDCVVSRRPPSVSARGKIDGILGQRERSPFTVRRMVASEDITFFEPDEAIGRRMVASEDITFFEPDEAIGMPRSPADLSGGRHTRRVRHGFRDGLAEIVMLQSSLLMGGSPDGRDLYRDLRLDVDGMSYEELLELGDRIGHVNTGLREDEIAHCLRFNKLAKLEMERKCSICQEEYERNDETGRLNCGHFFHIDCIKQWLVQKNICPICKTAAASQI